MTNSNTHNLTVGLVGLGVMGRGVAQNIMKKGYSLIGFDVNPSALEWLGSIGGKPARSLQEDMGKVDILISFVVNDVQTEEVLFGKNGTIGAINALKPHALVVTCSTMSPSYVKSLAQRLEDKGIGMVDAPVTGGQVGANAGTLTIMVAGKPEYVTKARPVLECFGSGIYVLGEQPGMGSQMKVINQLLCGVHIAAAGEALAMAKSQGLPLPITLEILRKGAANSWMLGDRGPRMVEENFDKPTSAIDIFVKDLSLVLDAAREKKFPATLAHAAYLEFIQASARGLGALDDSAVTTNYHFEK